MRCTRNAGGCACSSADGRRRSLEDRLAREAQASETQKETIRWQGGEVIRLHAELRRLRDQAEVVKSLSGETCRLWVTLGVAGAAKERLKARLLSASGAVLSKALFGRNGERQERPRSGASAQPATRRRRVWPHPAARARGEDGSAQPASRCARMHRLQEALSGERRRGLHHPRD